MIPGGQPIIVLQPGTKQEKGMTAQLKNIQAGVEIANAVRTTLGPKGMDKMLVDAQGDCIVSNDGVTILKELDVVHPAAKMVIEAAKTQDNKCGDGTTTAVILTGALLREAGNLIEKSIHPTVIIEGYNKALKIALEVIEEMSILVTPTGMDEIYQFIAETAMTGKATEDYKENLAKQVVDIIFDISEPGKEVDMDYVKILKMVGDDVGSTERLNGVVLGGKNVSIRKAHKSMPSEAKGKILFIGNSLEPKNKLLSEESFSFSNVEEAEKLMDMEHRSVEDIMLQFEEIKPEVVFCQKGIDETIVSELAKLNILAFDRIGEDDINLLITELGGSLVDHREGWSKSELGDGRVIVWKKEENEYLQASHKGNVHPVQSLIIKGSTEHTVDEIERGIHDALATVASVYEDEKVITGGASSYTQVAVKVREHRNEVAGRAKKALDAFAKGMESIANTLAENSGLDPIDTVEGIVHAHENGRKNAGINVYTGEIQNMLDLHVVEPLRVVRQALISAVETSQSILRIDDVLSAAGYEPEKQ